MKIINTAGFALMLSFLINCSTKITQEEKNKDYLFKAQKYIDSHLEKERVSNKETALSFLFEKIDKINYLSSLELENIKLKKFAEEVNNEGVKYLELLKIENAYQTGEYAPETKLQKEKYQTSVESLANWKKRAENLQTDDTITIQIVCSGTVTLVDGSKNKNAGFIFYFDKANDLDQKIMNYFYKL